MLSPQLLEPLRDWYRVARPEGWLFPGQNPVKPMTTRQLTRACHAAAEMAGIKKRVTPHTLRHTSRSTTRASHGCGSMVVKLPWGVPKSCY
jgi:integrase/recombinase XerD